MAWDVPTSPGGLWDVQGRRLAEESEPWEAFRDPSWHNRAQETYNRPPVVVKWAQEASDFRSIISAKEARPGVWICCWGHMVRSEWIQCAMLNWKDKPIRQRFKDHGHFAQHPRITMKQGLQVDESNIETISAIIRSGGNFRHQVWKSRDQAGSSTEYESGGGWGLSSARNSKSLSDSGCPAPKGKTGWSGSDRGTWSAASEADADLWRNYQRGSAGSEREEPRDQSKARTRRWDVSKS